MSGDIARPAADRAVQIGLSRAGPAEAAWQRVHSDL